MCSLFFYIALSVITANTLTHPIPTIKISSPFSDQRTQIKPEYIIIHYTANCSYKDNLQAFFNFSRPVSTHYLIGPDGKIIQMVPESNRAWHAGKSCWKNNTDLNSSSIGIELIDPGFSEPDKKPCPATSCFWSQNNGKHIFGSSKTWYDFTPEQVSSLISLCKDIVKRYSIAPQNILGHSDIALGRKEDPGPLFPWKKLAQQGLGIWWDNLEEIKSWTMTELQQKLKEYGYCIQVTGEQDLQTTNAIQAFQMHFEQENISGVPTSQTIQILNNLLSQIDQHLTNKSIVL